MTAHPAPHQTAGSFAFRKAVRTRYNFLVFQPHGSAPKSGWPLILFLHGAGERGSRLSAVTKHGIPKVAPQIEGFPFLCVSPQCPAGETWQVEALLGLLEHVIKKHRVDPRRVYLTGMSMGGYGTWSLAAAQPKRFAAVAPICGGGDVVSVLLADAPRLRVLKTLPIWAFHGGKDEVVPVSESERMVDAFRKIGNSPKLTIYPNSAHDCWTGTYENGELYSWLLSHRRK